MESERVKKLIDFAKEYVSRGWMGDFSTLCRKIVEIFEPLYKEYENQKIENAELKDENERLNKALVDNLEAYKDGFNEGAGLKKGVDDKLKTENQQLKDRVAELESENESFSAIVKAYKLCVTPKHCLEVKSLKDRIAELEKENKDYYDRLNNLQTYIDNHEEIWKINTKNALKQFAERLKEKGFILGAYKGVLVKDIDETLEEFIGEKE